MRFKVSIKMQFIRWLRGAMVARLTPDQKAACSSHVGVNKLFDRLSHHYFYLRRSRARAGQWILIPICLPGQMYWEARSGQASFTQPHGDKLILLISSRFLPQVIGWFPPCILLMDNITHLEANEWQNVERGKHFGILVCSWRICSASTVVRVHRRKAVCV